MITCNTCLYREGDECRRFPPTALIGACAYPIVKPTDWCGEHPDHNGDAPDKVFFGSPTPRPSHKRNRRR